MTPAKRPTEYASGLLIAALVYSFCADRHLVAWAAVAVALLVGVGPLLLSELVDALGLRRRART